MKKAGIFLVVLLASVIGVFAALRIDRWVEHNRIPSSLNGPDPVGVLQAQFTPKASAAGFDFRSAAKNIMPAVVSVDKSETWRDMWDRVTTANTGTGSGVIISRDGYILTNNHVVEGASSITVRTGDGKAHVAKLVGRDPRSDLAVIQIQATDLKPAELADSSKLEVGEWVMAVGNPLGYSNTLSVGVVSSLNRSLQAGREGTLLVDAIQTDAAINGGNSGGALTNDRGQVIGINTAIASPTGSNIGIGFAVPINRARQVVADIIKFGRVRYGYSGFDVYNGGAALQDPRARRYIAERVGSEPPEKGLVILRLDPEGPAAKLGVKQWDVLLEADGKQVLEPADLLKLMLEKKVGDKVDLKIWTSGSTKSLSLTLTDIPQGT